MKQLKINHFFFFCICICIVQTQVMAQYIGGGHSKPGLPSSASNNLGPFNNGATEPICSIVDLDLNCQCLGYVEWDTATGNCTYPITGYQVKYISQQGTNNQWVTVNLPATTTNIDFTNILDNTPSENEETFISVYAVRDGAKSGLMYIFYYDGDHDGMCQYVAQSHPGDEPTSIPNCSQTGAAIEVMVIDLQDIDQVNGCNSGDLNFMNFDDLMSCTPQMLGPKTNNKTVKNWTVSNQPNPFTTYNIVELDIPKTSPVSITLYDIQGKPMNTLLQNKIIEKGKHIFTLDGKDLPIGVYYYEIVIDGSSSIERILKM